MTLDIEIRDYSKKDFTTVKRFVWTPGQHTIRILDTKIPMKMCYNAVIKPVPTEEDV